MRPEPGFARREAYGMPRLKRDHRRRLLNRLSYDPARKEGAHGGTRGSPVKRAKRC